jgi:hypothetical protein
MNRVFAGRLQRRLLTEREYAVGFGQIRTSYIVIVLRFIASFSNLAAPNALPYIFNYDPIAPGLMLIVRIRELPRI